MNALVLWDVDHTLVENAGVSKEIYAAAFQALTDEGPQHPVRTEGRTDRLIMRDLFERHELVMPDWVKTREALVQAGAEHAEAMRARGNALPGVAEALKALRGVQGVVQSVLTGNVEENARMKVAAFGLDTSLDFAVGAYGSDSDDRADLVAVAQRRASDAYGRTFDKHNTVLIGDTPRDVDAGARGGAHVIAVASGPDTVEDLRGAGGELVLVDLTDTAAFVAAISRLTA